MLSKVIVAPLALFGPLAWAQYLPSNPVSSATPPALGSSFATSTSGVQGWRVSPSMTVGEVFSDNVSLAPSGSARSEWTTRVRPSVTVTENSARLRFSGTYTPELLYRSQQGNTDLSHYLNATGNAELWSRALFLDVRASISQQNTSLLGPQSDSNLNTTNNRTTVKTYGLSPYLRHDFGVDAQGELRFTHDAVHFGGNSASSSSSTSERLDAKLASGPAYKLFVWSLTASGSHVDYSQTGQKVDSQYYSISGGRLVTTDLRLNANVGYEDAGYLSNTGKAPKGAFWSVGPEWTPTERTRLAATFGHRYYGASRALNFSNRTGLTIWNLDYSENVTSTRSSFSVPPTLDTATIVSNFPFLQGATPAETAANVQQFITLLGLPANLTQPLNYLTDVYFRERRLQGSVALQGARNTVLASFFSSNRTSLSTSATGTVGGDFNASSTVKQSGIGLTWGNKLTQTLAANASFTATRNVFSATNRTDRLTTIRVGLSKEFNPKLSGSVSVGRVKNDTNAAGSGYTENSVSATLGLRY